MPSLGSVACTLIACFKIGHTACDLLLTSKSTRDSISFSLHYVLTFPAMRERETLSLIYRHKSSRKYQSNFLLKSLLTGERDLCAFSLNRANGFPATEYPGSFPLPNIGVAARVFSKAFAFFSTGTPESGAKLSDLSP